jgi:ActR/RegA family two-component response regulator
MVEPLESKPDLTGPPRILWIDPDIMSVVRYAKSLERRGATVDIARSLAHAMRLLAGASYDVAIIELTLPDAAGSDAWYEIHKVHPRMKGIITTRSSSLRSYVNPMGPGVAAFLLKPLDVDSLASIIGQVLGRTHALTSSISRASVTAGLYDEWFGRYGHVDWDFSDVYKGTRIWFEYYFVELEIYRRRIPFLNLLGGPARLSLRPALAALVVVLFLCLGSVGTMAVAAQGALPGEGLYPVKTLVETAQLVTAPDAASRVQLRLLFMSRRLSEIQALIAQGRFDQVPSTAAAYQEEVSLTDADLDQGVAGNPARATTLSLQLEAALAQNMQALNALQASAPVAVRGDLDRVLRSTANSLALLQLRMTQPGRVTLPSATGTVVAILELTETPTPTSPYEPTQTQSPQPTETLGLTGTTYSTVVLQPTETPELTNTPQPTETTQPTTTQGPNGAGGVTDTPTPTAAAQPLVTARPSNTPKPTETAEPSETARPSNTPAPSQTPRPSDTPQPSRTPAPPSKTPPPPSSTPKPTKTKVHPPPSPPPPTPKPSRTPKPTKTAKAHHAGNILQGAPTSGGDAHAVLAAGQSPSPERTHPVASFSLTDEFQSLLGFLAARIGICLDYLKMLLSSA